MGISFVDYKSAAEYAKEKETQGYKANVRQSGNVYVVDLSQERRDKSGAIDSMRKSEELERKNEELSKTLEQVKQVSGGGTGTRFVRNMGRGIGDVARSLSTSENKRRMRIAQMPGKRAPIASNGQSVNPISGHNAGTRRHQISNAPSRED